MESHTCQFSLIEHDTHSFLLEIFTVWCIYNFFFLQLDKYVMDPDMNSVLNADRQNNVAHEYYQN